MRNVSNNTVRIVLLILVFWGISSLMYAQTAPQPIPPEILAKIPANPILTAAEHPWGRFLPKSWVYLQKTTWTNHEGHRVANISETKTTLKSIDKDGVTLQEILSVDMAGKRVENAPVVRRFDFFQQPVQDDDVQIQNAPPTKLVVDNQVIPCEVRIYEQSTLAGKRKTTVWYSTQLYPYVFRVENVLKSLPDDKESKERILDMTVTEVLESSAFYLRKSKHGTYWLRTTQKSGSVTTVTEAFCSRHIPGGVIQKKTREYEGKGGEIQEIRTVETRLINYYCGVPPTTLPMNLPVKPLMTPSAPPFYYFEPIRPRWYRYYTVPSYPIYRNTPAEPFGITSEPRQ